MILVGFIEKQAYIPQKVYFWHWYQNPSITLALVSKHFTIHSPAGGEPRRFRGINATHLFLYSYIFQINWRSILCISRHRLWTLCLSSSWVHINQPPWVPACSPWFQGHIFCCVALQILCCRPPRSYPVSQLLCFPVGCSPHSLITQPFCSLVRTCLFCLPASLQQFLL